MQSVNALALPAKRSRQAVGSVLILQLNTYLLSTIIFLYIALSLPALLFLGWHYVGGGGNLEKIHPATYLLLVGLGISFSVDETFRWRFAGRMLSEPSLILFIIAVAAAAGYACTVKGASAAPFVDTFLAAIAATITVSCIPLRSLVFLRRLVDIFFILNIFVMFIEVLQQRNFFSSYLLEVSRTPEVMAVLGPQAAAAIFDRPSAFLGNPLDAGTLLGVYSIVNLVSTPVRFSKATIARLCLSLLSYLAIFPTGSRSAIVMATAALLLYLIYCALISGAMGRLNKAGLTLIGYMPFVLVPLFVGLWNSEFFATMLDRFQYDNGSALARDYAWQMLTQASAADLWFGRPVSEILAAQQSSGLIAIEISWVNFILVGGFITAVPLFVAYVLFLFRSTRRYCRREIYFVSLFILVVTGTSNGIWSKTTVLTASLVVAVSFLRRDLERSGMQTRSAFVAAKSCGSQDRDIGGRIRD